MGNCWTLQASSKQRSRSGQNYRLLSSLPALHDTNLTPEGNPLPPVIHATIRQSDLSPGRLIIVSDVHGCLPELLQLLDTVGFKAGQDNLIFTRDLVNKGPRSQEVAAMARVLCEGSAWSVRGNNDDAALAAWWNLQQGILPPETKHSWVGDLLPEDVNFIMNLPFSLTVEGYNLIVVHGGLVPGIPLQQQDLQLVSAMRDMKRAPDGSWIGLERAQEGSLPWAGFWEGPSHVVFGHDSMRRLQACPYATGIDTACCSGGQLTACVLPPLRELRQNAAFVSKVQRGLTQSLRDMQGYLVSVPSGTDYDGDG